MCDIQDPGRAGPGPGRDWSEADLLAEGFAANLSALKALQQRCKLSNAEAAALCGVTLRTYRRWRSEGNPPASAVRLLAVLAGYVPWEGWSGWEVDRGYLFPPGFSRHGILPGEFFALVFTRQQVGAYRQENAKLKARLALLEQDDAAGLRAQLEALEAELERYRAAARELAELGARTRPGLQLVQAAGSARRC